MRLKYDNQRLTLALFSGGAKRGRGARGGKRAGERPAKTQEELDKEMTVREIQLVIWKFADSCFDGIGLRQRQRHCLIASPHLHVSA